MIDHELLPTVPSAFTRLCFSNSPGVTVYMDIKSGSKAPYEFLKMFTAHLETMCESDLLFCATEGDKCSVISESCVQMYKHYY